MKISPILPCACLSVLLIASCISVPGATSTQGKNTRVNAQNLTPTSKGERVTHPTNGEQNGTIVGVLLSSGFVLQQDGSGQPVSDAIIRVEGTDKKTKSNAKGEFRLEGVPLDKKFALVAEKPDVNGKNFKARVVKRIEPAKKTLDLGSLFLRQTGSVFGSVTLANQSDYTGIDVFIAGTSLSAKTDSHGAFALADIAEGEYQITAFKEGYLPQTTATIKIEPGKPTQAAAIALPIDTQKEQFGTLTGTVTSGGQLLVGATVSLVGSDLTKSHVALTDEKGRYTIGRIEPNGSALMPDKEYQIVVHRDFYDTVIETASFKKGETVTKNVALLSQEVTLGRLTTTVKDCDGNPVSNALIQLDPAPAFAQNTFTDTTGTLLLTQLFPGKYTVYAAKGMQKTFEGIAIDNKSLGQDGQMGALVALTIQLGACSPVALPQDNSDNIKTIN